MKRSHLQLLVLLGLVLVIVFLSGCGGSDQPAAAAGDGDFQPPAGENGNPAAQGFPAGGAAFGEANQLALGTLYLQSTDYPISAEQAAALLPLWQAYQSQQAGEDFDPEQGESLLADIEAALTADQQAVIEAIPQEDLFAWAQEQGLMGGFAANGEPPDFDELSDEERATLQAGRGQQGPPEGGTPPAPPDGGTPQGGGFRGGGFANPLIDAVIAMLEELS